MECSEFEAILQDLLDRRLPLPLSQAARAHLRHCSPCEQDYHFFQQLAGLTQRPTPDTPASQKLIGSTVIDPAVWTQLGSTEPGSERNLEQVIGRCVASLGNEFDSAEPTASSGFDAPQSRTGHYPAASPSLPANQDEIPVATLVGLPGAGLPGASRGCNSQRTARTLHLSWAPLAAVVTAAMVLLAVGGLVWHRPPTDSELPRATADAKVPTDSPTDSAQPQGLARIRPAPLATDDLREIAKNWDDSVAAFDRGWQQMAVGRVRAHQIPGMQPAVYPITGAVEAFRKNWIRRNPDGLAAGLQW